ncbi:MAG: hypothetical protein D6812_03460 [Deltaproteobacteria bacterium]|nr:MAG: hypothetical protein D6812_03460 [Deltaproteobacteria bacterium]
MLLPGIVVGRIPFLHGGRQGGASFELPLFGITPFRRPRGSAEDDSESLEFPKLLLASPSSACYHGKSPIWCRFSQVEWEGELSILLKEFGRE